MRWLLSAAMLAIPVSAQYTLYTCMVNARDYVVGAKLPPSGIFLKSRSGAWRHAGFNHPILSALDYDPFDPSTIYVAAGNGLPLEGTVFVTVNDRDKAQAVDIARRFRELRRSSFSCCHFHSPVLRS